MLKKYALTLAFSLALPAAAVAAVASSTNYQIVFDSVNSGGKLSTSTSYGLEDTVGEFSVGTSSSASYQVNAGYQQNLSGNTISVSSPANVSIPNLSGFSGGSTSSTTAWTVITDSGAGYQLLVRAGTSPALQGSGGSNFLDYHTGTPDFSFAYGTTEALFGYSPEGSDVVSRFRDNGAACSVGGGETSDSCYVGFTTSDVPVASGAGPTAGTATTLRFRAGVGSDRLLTSGSYSATIVVTAVSL